MNIALTGLNAATLRVATSADNIANAHTTSDPKNNGGPYIPKDVVQTSQDTGGTIASVVDSDKPPVTLYNPTHPDADINGIVAFPNIDTAQELVNASEAASAYKATLNIIKSQSNLYDTLFNAFA